MHTDDNGDEDDDEDGVAVMMILMDVISFGTEARLRVCAVMAL